MKRLPVRISLLLFAGLMTVAALLRLPGDSGFANYYEPELYRDLAAVRDIADGRASLVGPSQFLDARYHFGPACNYLMLPLAWLTGFRSWSLSLTSLVSSLAAIALGVFACERWFKNRTVTVAYAIIAVFSSIDVQFAKYGSSPNFAPPFVLAFFLCLEPFLRRGARWYHACGLGFSLAVAAQLHPVAGIGLALVAVAAFATGRLRLTAREAALATACALAPYAGYLTYEVLHGFENARGLFSLATGTRQFGGWGSRLAETAAFWTSLWFNVHHMFSVSYLLGMRVLALMYGTVAVIGATYWYDRRHRGRAEERTLVAPHRRALLALWFAMPTVLLLIPFGRINQLPIYYFVSLIPLAHVLMALGYAKLRERGLRRTADVAFAAYLAWQIGQIALYHAHYPSMLSGAVFG